MTKIAFSCDEEAWVGLEDQRSNLVRFLSRRCRDANDVEDIVQETLMRAARYRKRLDRPERLSAWISSIAVNVLADRARKAGRQQRQLGDEHLLDALPARDSRECALNEEHDVRCGNWRVGREKALSCLSSELHELEQNDRELLLRFYGGEGGCREVASEYGLTPSIVKVRLFRARNRLLRALTRRFALVEQLPSPQPCL